jgi:hypothetical protein
MEPITHDDESIVLFDDLPQERTEVADAWSNIEPPADDAPIDQPIAREAPVTIAPPAEPVEAAAPPEEEEEEPQEEGEESGGWMVAVLCGGIAIIAACLLLPLAEENHQLAWQREKLKVDLEQIKQQVEVNGEFLKRVNDDPTLAERLAQRQMKFIRKGTTILDLPDAGGLEQASPFQLVNLPPPAPMPAYRPMGGTLTTIILNSRVRLYLIGVGLLLLATGLVLGGGTKQTYDPS